jgi:hypothetical protein
MGHCLTVAQLIGKSCSFQLKDGNPEHKTVTFQETITLGCIILVPVDCVCLTAEKKLQGGFCYWMIVRMIAGANKIQL